MFDSDAATSPIFRASRYPSPRRGRNPRRTQNARASSSTACTISARPPIRFFWPQTNGCVFHQYGLSFTYGGLAAWPGLLCWASQFPCGASIYKAYGNSIERSPPGDSLTSSKGLATASPDGCASLPRISVLVSCALIVGQRMCNGPAKPAQVWALM